MIIPFTKMQALGNDFVVIDATESPFQLTSDEISKMANRRLGVGFDQMLVLEPSHDKDIDFTYRIFNADGHEVEQCGNGARCIARFMSRSGLTDQREIKVKTSNSMMTLRLQKENQVAVDMGQPKFDPSDIPFIVDEPAEHYSLQLENTTVTFDVVNVGELSSHPNFPQGINVGFMQLIDADHIHLRVYERGAGETPACGSGACAAMVIGRRQDLLQDRVRVTQAGGDVIVEWDEPDSVIIMTGPADFVYHGEWLKRVSEK